MSDAAAKPPAQDARSLAAILAPQVIDACAGRLSDIVWFRTDWQRGGAATATASLRNGDGRDCPVVIKLPVVQRELLWTRRLQRDDALPSVVPRLFAGDETLAGYDLAWMVIEKFDFGPIGAHWHDDHIRRMVAAAASFQKQASAFPVDRVPVDEPWHEMIDQAGANLKINPVADEKRWLAALRTMRHRLDALVSEWHTRAMEWIHGDLHPANAMSRVANDHGEVSLIDLAEVRAGHWIEDAIYLERLFWARPDRLKPHKPVRALADARRALGLPVDPDYPRLAMIRRALLAATAPRFIKSEGSPAYLSACLQRLEAALSELR